MLCREGKLSLSCFSAALIIALLPELVFRLELDNNSKYLQNIWLTYFLQYSFCNFLLPFLFCGFEYQVALRSTFLGYVVGVGITIFSIASPSWQMFGAYMTMLAIFHYSEFLSIAWANPSSLSIDSFVLNHSIAYGIAASFSWIEYVLERQLYPQMKMASFISYFGLILSILGEVLRKTAIFTAKNNFNHLVQSEKKKDHVLITHGIYAIFRHPSYVGWFYWAIGTQLILQNPLSLLVYVISSWRFFHDRILIEELMLWNFFGDAYIEYQNKVPTGLPFISGNKIKST
ncbi:PREDICTED: protein-S-isoprenylcysteine O-methyltransferase [Polistes canadensis]|uniref:protein-S-isoprenylcysteine O-methyltransferase n=1 Tax=Polistes canadensis TaxID=91411 RepID=UPI000718E097|nr:PREDICTED: protein-S-isoprenylcysteine O-methyltransferase [Polistes canadensis]